MRLHKEANKTSDQLVEWVVNDYFTPNIKAEVILDTLLSPYVGGIIKHQCGDKVGGLSFVTKEMSVEMYCEDSEKGKYGDMGTKIDYILADEEKVYLVELKTTDSSIEPEQAKRYRQNCAGGTFGSVFGDKLLRILSRKTNLPTDKLQDGERRLLTFFESVTKKYDAVHYDRSYAGQAKALLRQRGWGSTYKYLYTAGQILDYTYPKNGNPRLLWGKPLRLLYLTPNGSLPHKEFKLYEDFYICPERTGSVSLREAAAYLAGLEGPARTLAEILNEIYSAEILPEDPA